MDIDIDLDLDFPLFDDDPIPTHVTNIKDHVPDGSNWIALKIDKSKLLHPIWKIVSELDVLILELFHDVELYIKSKSSLTFNISGKHFHLNLEYGDHYFYNLADDQYTMVICTIYVYLHSKYGDLFSIEYDSTIEKLLKKHNFL